MKVNLNDLTTKIRNHDVALVDDGYLTLDMEPLYEYLKSEDPSTLTPRVKEYFSNHNSYDFKEFTVAYIGDLCEVDINYDYDEEGWMRLFSVETCDMPSKL